MRIRHDSVLIASVLFTIALFCLVPWSWRYVFPDQIARIADIVPNFELAARAMSNFGVASLAIIFIGLIVTWVGYVKRVRWAWFVMFIIAWAWAFPVLVLPLLTHNIGYTFIELLYGAMVQRGFARTSSQSISIISLMVIALLLPVRSLFFVRGTQEPIHTASPRFKTAFVMFILVIVPAVLVWIRFRSYELTPAELNWQSIELSVPPPPPPAPTQRPSDR
jgi:hypothetical protein